MKFNHWLGNNWKWGVSLLLVLSIWAGVAPDWYLWYAEKDNGLWMKELYRFLDNRWKVNIPICVVVTYLVYCWCLRIYKDNDLRLFRLCIILVGLFVLFWESRVEFARVVYCLDYKMFMTFWLSMLFVSQVRCICNQWKNNDGINQKRKGFSDDSVKNENISETLKSYASLVVSRALATNTKEHSYAIGITGEWGVGKSTFLSLIEKEISKQTENMNKAEIVRFNPWMCRSPEQVIQDFFSSLRHQLSPKYSTLSKSIKEYAQYINNLTLSTQGVMGVGLKFTMMEDSLYRKKQLLSDKFSELPNPVVVIIDDIDRLHCCPKRKCA